jgi:hypothetical protein
MRQFLGLDFQIPSGPSSRESGDAASALRVPTGRQEAEGTTGRPHSLGFSRKDLDWMEGSPCFRATGDRDPLAARLMSRRPAMSNFKLLTVAKVLGLDVDGEKVHDAKYDIALTMEMYRRLIA